MFKKTVIVGLFVLFVFCLGSFFYFYSPSSKAQASYEALVKLSSHGETIKRQRQLKQTKQKRLQVSKQYLFNSDNQRLEWRLNSHSSEIVFCPKSKIHEGGLLENFKDMHLVMQEKLFITLEGVDQQVIRELKADQAIYFYQKGKLVANQVHLNRYLLPFKFFTKNLKNENILLKGTSESIQLSFSPSPQLKAQGFKATLHDWRDQ